MSNILVDYLKKCDDAYYNTSNPIVNDDTYDALVETLRRLNPSHPYLKKVGAKVKSNKLGRLVPMGTLSKYHKEEEVAKWLASEGGDILLSPKYDGFAVELVYTNGKLWSASTRGDGYVGEDVLSAMKQVKSVPSNLPADMTVTVRGEAIIPLIHHDKVKELGYSAMRNAVPGIVRSNRADALQYVDFVAYEFIDDVTDRVFQREKYRELFIVEDYRVFDFNDLKGINSRREELRGSAYLYELDGVVLKTRYIKEDDLLNPSHMVSWKYKSNREATTLRDIEYQMGLTGYFTPIGIFDEVEFQGAKLTRASLGNMTRLANDFEGLTIGSIVEVSRRGDIIPYIEELTVINEGGDKVEGLVYCPHCGEVLEYDNKEPHCVNKACPEKLRLQLSQFAKAVGIKGIGDKLVRGLIDGGHIKSIIDIYNLDSDVILSIPRQGQSSVDKWNQLQEKKLTAVELLTAYPFIDLGKKVWESLFKAGYTYEDLLYLTKENLVSAEIRGIGESKIENIVSQIQENRVELMVLGQIHNLM